jgi:hypothetical protein
MASREVVPSAARTTTGQSAAQQIGAGDELSLLLDCTAVSGSSPSLTLSVEWSDNGTDWHQSDVADAFTAITAAGKKVKEFDVKGDYYRVVWTISGTTPSFTFQVVERL